MNIDLRKGFLVPDISYRPVPFWHLDGNIGNIASVKEQLMGNKQAGYGGVALLPVAETTPAFDSEAYYKAIEGILEELKKHGMSAIYYDDKDFPSGWVGGKLLAQYPDTEGKELNKDESSITGPALFEKTINLNGSRTGTKPEEIVAASAVNADTKGVLNVDQDASVSGSTVSFNVPAGNWKVYIYTCRTYSFHNRLDYLNYDSSKTYVNLTYRNIANRFASYIGSTIKMTFYDDIRFLARNGRSWGYDFNQRFEQEYGIDPRPYYAALETDIGDNTEWFRAAWFGLRAKLLSEGFFKAVGDWAGGEGILATGHVANPAGIDQTNNAGDSMLYQKYVPAPGMDDIHAFLHGFDGFKLTASSAYNWDKDKTVCEIYGNYDGAKDITKDVIYKEAINAYMRGINYLIPHGLWFSGVDRIRPELSYKSTKNAYILPDYTTWAARNAYMLQNGRHVADIGLLYPVRSLNAQGTLSYNDSDVWAINPVPKNADYMNVINSIMNDCHKDLTILHPETLNERCSVENNEIRLNNEVNYENYKVFVIPGSSMIELSNLEKIKEFYDNGGKVIATTVLPDKSFEKGRDDEVKAIINEMFEADVTSGYSVKENSNGGKAYFIPQSGLGRGIGANTYSVATINSDTMNTVLNDALSVYDVTIEDRPKLDTPGFLNIIHKVKEGVDIYNFGNSSDTNVSTHALIRGKILPEIWDPMTGGMYVPQYEYINEGNETVTRIKLDLPHITSLYIVDAANILKV